MAYTLSASGRKSDVIGTLRQQAAQQSAALPSQGERDNLTASLDEAEGMVNQYAGDTDSVSVSVSGHISQSDTALGMSKNVGISISRGAAGAAETGTATRVAGVPGAPTPEQPAVDRRGATPNPIPRI